jgi:SAM-dependent methyltransferase
MSNQEEPSPFDAYYFAHGCGRPYQRDESWLAFFAGIAKRIADEIRPRSVLDAGCAMGFLVESLRGLQIEAYGIDLSEYAIEQVHPSIKACCWQGSIVEPLARDYDLIVCIEVLEHMQAREAEVAIANLCGHADNILFSSTPFDYKEATHFNVRPPEYWAERFALHGFVRDVDYDASYITPWATRFIRATDPIHRIVRNYERRFFYLWKENSDQRQLINSMRQELSKKDDEVQNLARGEREMI